MQPGLPDHAAYAHAQVETTPEGTQGSGTIPEKHKMKKGACTVKSDEF